MLKDFKPALFFLLKFLAVYFVGNILYGLYIESTTHRADIFTRSATYQTAIILKALDADVKTEINPRAPTVFVKKQGNIVLNIFEGCNGINVIIVFVAFLIAFGGSVKRLGWFIPLGILIIHLANLGRLSLLYFVTLYYEQYFYFIHKYFFTGILYLIVFILWILWVMKINTKKTSNGAA